MLMESFDRLSRKEKYVWDVSNLISQWKDTYACVGHLDIWPCKLSTLDHFLKSFSGILYCF